MKVPKVPEREPVNGAAILDGIHEAMGQYVVFPSPEAHDAAVLYAAATHGQPAWEHAPRLAITSPEKRCGKSRLLDVMENICHEPLITVNISIAGLVHSIHETDPPTLMVDEADAIFGTKRSAEQHEDLRGILNAGHQRNRPYSRWDITKRVLEECPTFAMAILASIRDLPDTIMDRSIKIRMRRRALDEVVKPYRLRRDGVILKALRDPLHDWVREHLDQLREAVPAMPIEDREADNWEPLFALAELADGDWPDRAAKACHGLTKREQDYDRIGHDLLADLHSVWRPTEQHLYSSTLLERLCQIDESPWLKFGRERLPLDPRGLAELLRPYGIKPGTVREPGARLATSRGYARGQMLDAWNRYCGLTGDTGNTSDTGDLDELF